MRHPGRGCGPSSKLPSRRGAIPAFSQGVKKSFLGFRQIANRFFHRMLALPHPRHDFHSGFDQLAHGLQPPIEYFHALIEPGLHLIAPLDASA